MTNGHVPAALLAREATRRKLHEPPREPQPRRPRRVAARALHLVAVRLDPCVSARVELGR